VASLNDVEEDDGPLASINIIPFVDIVLVLLVIFMLTSATIVRASLKVELPKAASGGGKVESTINLLYNREGELFLNGDKLASIGAAAARIRAESRQNPKVQAVISADRGVQYGRVVEIIDVVKQNGVGAFALDIERGPAPGGGGDTSPASTQPAAPGPGTPISPAAIPPGPP
jgi:biopolymer transport protein ExbD